MSHILHLRSLLLLLLSICLLAPLQTAWADSATVTIGTAASSNGAWSGASPDVWTPGASGVSAVAVSEISDRLATGGVVISSGSSIAVATPISWSSSNPLTLNAGTDISITAAISATSGILKLYYGSSYSLNNGAKVTLSAGNHFYTKQGSGSETSWTVITSLGSHGSITGTDLQGINGNLSGNYVLGADIDASATSSWNSDGSGGYYGFDSIGNSTTPFTGRFNGLGHIISNLYINRNSTIYLSLFGNNSGSISNVGVAGGSITGKNKVGGLVGYNTGSISNAYASVDVTGTNSVGGLAGYNYGGSISYAYATGSASGANSYTGGLVGYNSGSISYSYATGSVTGTTTDTGGLVGYNSGSISNAFAIGSVTGVTNVGGLVGNNASGTYSNDFWNSTTTGQAYGAGGSTTPTGVTGLTSAQMRTASNFSAWGTEISSTGGSTSVWRIYNGYTYPLLRTFMATITITPAFDDSGTPLTNIADVTAEGYNAGLVLGTPASTLTLSSSSAGSYTASVTAGGFYSSQQGYDLSYADRTISTPGSAAGDILISNPITWTSGTLAINTSGTISATAAINGSGSTIFNLQSGTWSQTGSLPNFSVTDFRISGGSFIRALGGDGTSSNPYQIADIYGLQGIASSAMLNKSYTLASDISASCTASWNSGAGFKPIGTYTTNFTGNFNGQNHTIDGLVIKLSSTYNVGLFGSTSIATTISNIGLTNVSITAYSAVGGLVGYNNGSISNSYATGSVTGYSDYVGGLIGRNYGNIGSSHTTTTVDGGHYYVGGLVGLNNGSISGCYAAGSVDGYSYVGGLIGYSQSSAISNVFATASVYGLINYVGGLIGYNYRGTINNAYATGAVTGSEMLANAGGLVGYNSGGTISNTYIVGNVPAGTASGGLIGTNTGDITHSFFGCTGGFCISVGSGSSAGVIMVLGNGLKKTYVLKNEGWDISSTGGSSAIWRIYEDKTYPLLRSFLTPMSVTANNAAKNYDGTTYNGGNGVQYAPAGYNAAKVLGSLNYAGSSQGATAIGSYTITPDGLYSDQLGYDISFISGVLNINGYWLTLGISGSGTVNSSNGSGLGYACNTATCTAVPFGSGDTVTLTATGSNSSFSNWSEDYVSISNPGSITMDTNKAVTATFAPDPAKVKIDGDSTPYYSINTALAAPAQDATIKATATGFTENVTMQNSHTLTLKGGYSDSNFTSQTGNSTINGTLTISSGTLIVDRVVMGP